MKCFLLSSLFFLGAVVAHAPVTVTFHGITYTITAPTTLYWYTTGTSTHVYPYEPAISSTVLETTDSTTTATATATSTVFGTECVPGTVTATVTVTASV